MVWDLYHEFLSDVRIADNGHREMTWLLIKHGAKSIKSRVGAKQAEQFLLGDHAPPEGRPMKNILFSAFGTRRPR
jgi:hypothetical protein